MFPVLHPDKRFDFDFDNNQGHGVYICYSYQSPPPRNVNHTTDINVTLLLRGNLIFSKMSIRNDG